MKLGKRRLQVRRAYSAPAVANHERQLQPSAALPLRGQTKLSRAGCDSGRDYSSSQGREAPAPQPGRRPAPALPPGLPAAPLPEWQVPAPPPQQSGGSSSLLAGWTAERGLRPRLRGA